LPAGKKDEGEPTLEAMLREMFEETQCTVDRDNISFVSKDFVRDPHYDFIFVTYKTSFEKKPWAYTSGGTLPTLLKTYFRREGTFSEETRWVESPQDLYYQSEFDSAANRYIPCISRQNQSSGAYFQGRVTDYLQKHLPAAEYDFYLCGRRTMIRDATALIDEKFGGSRLFIETYD